MGVVEAEDGACEALEVSRRLVGQVYHSRVREEYLSIRMCEGVWLLLLPRIVFRRFDRQLDPFRCCVDELLAG